MIVNICVPLKVVTLILR